MPPEHAHGHPPVGKPLLLCTRTKMARVSMLTLRELTFLQEEMFLSINAWLCARRIRWHLEIKVGTP